MPAVAIVAALALSEVGITAATVGTALLGGTTAVAAIEGGTIIASTLGGAVIGAGTGALSAAIQGGDIGKGALMGAVSGGVGAGVGAGISQALSPGMSTIDLNGANYAPPEIAGSQALGAGVTKGISSFAGQTAGALAGGQPLESALKSGLISGVSGGLGAGIGTEAGLSGTQQSLLSGALGFGLGKAFQPSRSTSVAAQAAGPSGIQIPTATPGSSTSTLGSALFAAPGFSYTPGGPVLGGSSDDKTPKNVWSETDKSLRDVGSTVT